MDIKVTSETAYLLSPT